jgi:uncharacterized protein (DUF305 family)
MRREENYWPILVRIFTVTKPTRVAGSEYFGYVEIMSNLATRKVFKIVAVSAISVFSISACASNNVSGPTSSQSADGMMGNGMNDSALSAADIMFLQMMIPHHEQAIEMSKLAATNTKNPDVLDLAARIEAAQQPEIDLMKKLLADAGQSDMPGHSMGDNGMMSESDMAALAGAKDSGFDALYLTGMIAHHNGAIAMAGSVSDSLNPEVKTLVTNIITSQTAEIAEMTDLLAEALAL